MREALRRVWHWIEGELLASNQHMGVHCLPWEACTSTFCYCLHLTSVTHRNVWALWGPDDLSLLIQNFCRSVWYSISLWALVPFSFGPWMRPPITQEATPPNEPRGKTMGLNSTSRTHWNQNKPKEFLVHSNSACPQAILNYLLYPLLVYTQPAEE